MKKRKTVKPQGFIAILSLLIITTISMIFAMSMLKDGLDVTRALRLAVFIMKRAHKRYTML